MAKIFEYLFCRRWRFFWLSAWLVALFVVVPSAAGIALERSDWKAEIESLKNKLLYSLSCFNQISKLATEQNTQLEGAQRLLDEQKKLLDSSQKRIDYLLSQIVISRQSSADLLKELELLQSLQNQAQRQYEKLLKAFNNYKLEAEKQIEEIQEERDQARGWLAIVGIGAFLLGGLVGAMVF